MKTLSKLSACAALVVCIACGSSGPPTAGSGQLVLTISGLPTGTNASVTVTGPGSYSHTSTATETLTGLADGSYTVTANNVTQAPYSYGGTITGSPASVSSSAGANVTVAYAAITGALSITINGLPSGTNANVVVTGPNSFSQNVTATGVLGTLVPGTYTITVNQARVSGPIVDQAYVGSSSGGTATVAAGATATNTVTYSAAAGSGMLWVAISNGAIVGYDSAQLTTGGVGLTPAVTVSTTGHEEAVAFDRASNAWVADLMGRLAKYTPSQLASSGSPSPGVVLTGASLTNPLGLAFDGSGNAWLTNIVDSTVVKFLSAQLASGGSSPANVTITGFSSPAGIAFEGAGNLWVSNQQGVTSTVVMFLPAQVSGSGSPTPTVTLSPNAGSLNNPAGLAFDSTNNLWVSNYAGNTIVKFTPAQRAAPGGSIAPAVTLMGAAFSTPSCVAFDNAGSLWVVSVGSGSLQKFTATQIASSGSPTATTTITGVPVTTPDLGWCAFSPAPAALPILH